ncbi:MAG: hypothetical protein ACJASK_000864, partial [Ilumatobacter sp.]
MATVIAAKPDWFTDVYLGIELEQYIGIGVLAIVATLAHFALLRLITIIVHRRYVGDDLTFWEGERRRVNRGILLLATGTTLLVGFPTLDFDPDVESVVHQAATLAAAAAIILVAYRVIDILVDVLTRRAGETETMLDD